jgi:exodeoxyribonuclease-3
MGVKMRIISWNVNGIRSAAKKGLIEWIGTEQPDMLCIQETKAEPSQLTKDIREIQGYKSYFNSAEKKGYSGTALYTKIEPVLVKYGMGIERFDNEGRMVIAEFDDFIVYNVYFPNGKQSADRLAYKMDFYDTFLQMVIKDISKGKSLIICGDINTAHTEIDLSRPKENEKVSGFLPEERAWINSLISAGFSDSFRMFVKEGGNYTWWDMKSGARARNVGWRIDYFFIDTKSSDRLKNASIMKDIQSSDHCPVAIEIT